MKKIVLFSAFAMCLFFPSRGMAFQAAVISDIQYGTNLCNAKQCGRMVEDSLQEVLNNTGDMLLISAGDNVDASQYVKNQKKATAFRQTYKARLLEMVGDRQAIWANGNHDRETYLSGKEYYSLDKENWRIIVIHTTQVKGAQYRWLEKQLKTDKKVMVVMHHPIFQNGSKKVISNYKKIEKLFSKNKVKYVLSGHWHSNRFERVYNGVTYKAIQALTYNFKTRYTVMDLN